MYLPLHMEECPSLVMETADTFKQGEEQGSRQRDSLTGTPTPPTSAAAEAGSCSTLSSLSLPSWHLSSSCSVGMSTTPTGPGGCDCWQSSWTSIHRCGTPACAPRQGPAPRAGPGGGQGKVKRSSTGPVLSLISISPSYGGP